MPEQRRYEQTSDGSERTLRANLALDTYIEWGPEFEIEGRDVIITDLFTDLHHLAEAYEFDIDDLWRIAKDHYQAESADPEED